MKTSLPLLAGCIACFIFITLSCTEQDTIAPELSMKGKITQRSATLTPMEELGKEIFFDKISVPGVQSCASCHSPKFGYTGPNSGINIHSGVYRGAVATRAGNRKPPSAAYATFSPIFHYNTDVGCFVGGNFWDGRATGDRLGNPAADQALGPFLNPVEQNAPNREFVLEEIAGSSYASLWETVWGEPISTETPEAIAQNYDRVGLTIAAYEASSEVNSFSSKYDYFLAGEVDLTAEEAWGLTLFNGKGKCNLCHPSDGPEALFTDFTYDNLGLPKNPYNPMYDTEPTWIDEGLGGYLATIPGMGSEALANRGKHKVPTLRNVDKRKGPGNTKAYGHNGVFKSLEDIVHFYNTRDVPGADWPEPEVADNINSDELGNLGLTPEEEAAIVAFMKTLSDGYDL